MQSNNALCCTVNEESQQLLNSNKEDLEIRFQQINFVGQRAFKMLLSSDDKQQSE